MKKINLIVLLLSGLSGTGVMAQQAVLTSGGNNSGTGGSVSYSIGQIDYNYQTGSSGSCNEGVQQPYEFFSVGIDDPGNINLSISVYPNPSNSTVNLLIENENFKNMFYQLFDENGQLIFTESVTGSSTLIPMEKNAPGIYLLSVFNEKKIIKSFTLIKNQ